MDRQKSRREAENPEERLRREKYKEKSKPNSNDSTTADDEAKMDQPRSKHGVRNASRSRPSRKKEDDTEAKPREGRTRAKATQGEPV